jgi:hypothetical protein
LPRKHSLVSQIAEVEREIAMRREVCPRLVRSRKMKQGAADIHIATMESVLQTLRWLQANEAAMKDSMRDAI